MTEDANDLATHLATSDPLADARAELAAGRWSAAEAILVAHLAAGEDPEARFAHGIAAWWQDRTPEAMRDWEQAYVAFRRQFPDRKPLFYRGMDRWSEIPRIFATRIRTDGE